MQKMIVFAICVALALPMLAGCSKDIGRVTGTVKINGEPVEGAVVTFAPVGGRSSFAKTDAEGNFEMVYQGDTKGAALGENQVYITSYVPPEVDDNEKVVVPAKPERFPPEWNENSEQKVMVESGDNHFDFDVKADKESYTRRQGS